MRVPLLRPAAVLALLLAAVLACGDDSPNQPEPPSGVVPDFSILDVNANSSTFDQHVSPRQYAGKISAWYFGHST